MENCSLGKEKLSFVSAIIKMSILPLTISTKYVIIFFGTGLFFLFWLLFLHNVLSNDYAVLSIPRRDPKMVKTTLSLASSIRGCELDCKRGGGFIH